VLLAPCGVRGSCPIGPAVALRSGFSSNLRTGRVCYE
jgi:hypothetical protein